MPVPRFSFLPFATGFTFTLIGLCLAGSFLSSQNVFKRFDRFNVYITPETQYFPTARQVAALVNERARDPAKVAVIVGGSSVLRGTGQQTAELWSSKLQQKLGEKFVVINLAANAGRVGGYGLSMAEMLLKRGRRVIFLVDVNTQVEDRPDGAERYRYFYYDARQNGLLLQWPPREAVLTGSREGGVSSIELRVKALLNGALGFDDLWSVVGYRLFNSVWTVHTSTRFWEARERKADPETHPASPYPHPIEPQLPALEAELAGRPSVERAVSALEATLPRALLPHTIGVELPGSPNYERRLDSDLQRIAKHNRAAFAERLREHGFNVVRLEDSLTEADFVDLWHLSNTGGEKLAALLAPAVEATARALDYAERD